jgi:hypothetical protein
MNMSSIMYFMISAVAIVAETVKIIPTKTRK